MEQDGDVYFLPSGNVGIGTTSPQAKLHIAGTPGTDGIMFPDSTLQKTAAEGKGAQYNGTVIYNAVVPTTWTELDISSIVGERSAMVFLKVKGDLNRHITVTPYAERENFMRQWAYSNLYQYHSKVSADDCSLLMTYTDADGKLGIISWAYTATWEITLIAYF
jgi:hypothetical protein